jgi:hypothetical protein
LQIANDGAKGSTLMQPLKKPQANWNPGTSEVQEMADSNPKLTMQLHDARETLLVERTDIIRRVQKLQEELYANSSKIEATDNVMRLFNSEHISLDLRSHTESTSMLVVGDRTLNHASSIVHAEANATAASEPKAASKAKAASKPKVAFNGKKKLTVAEQIEAIDAALGAKSERSPERQAISSYFQKSGRNDTILKILESKDEPVNAATVARDYKALYPLPEDSATMKSLHASKVGSALYYLKARGQAIRLADERADGKTAENVRWELSKSYRRDLRRGRTAGRSKANEQSSVGTEQTGDEVRIAVGAR